MPGISVSKIPIPFRGAGGISWQTYWATLISATVENAAPTHVVLTFPTAQTSLGATDFTIAGFTVSSASWTGAVLTLVLSTPVVMFIGNLTITFVPTGETAVVINNTDDGNTVGWYCAGDGSSAYMALDGSNKVSQWNDLSGANHHLLQNTEIDRPLFQSDKIVFSGTTNGEYLRSDAFTYSQPEMVYVVFVPIREAGGEFIDGVSGRSSIFAINNGLNGTKYFMYAGVVATTNIDMITYKNSISIGIALTYGVNSFLRINGTMESGLNAGTGNMGGITLGTSQLLGAANYFGGYIYELICRNVADDIATRTAIENYLKEKYGVFF